MTTDFPQDLPRLPQRPSDSHKGTFGTVIVIGGHADEHAAMIGAPALAATAALRAGCGLCKLVTPEPILPHALTICPSATGIPLPIDPATGEVPPHEAAETLDRLLASLLQSPGGNAGVGSSSSSTHAALAIGPGLGASAAAHSLTLRAIQQEQVPVVLDADALNCLAQTPDLFRDLHAAAVLTPHPGEFKRLCQGLGLKNNLGLDDPEPTPSGARPNGAAEPSALPNAPGPRERAAEQLAQRLARVIVLKGAHTVVSDGLRTWTCPISCPALATAGTGDVLTGVTASLIAQLCESPQRALMRAKVPQMPRDPQRPLDLYDAARVAVHIHALAGQSWSTHHAATGGLLAMELTTELPAAIESMRADPPPRPKG